MREYLFDMGVLKNREDADNNQPESENHYQSKEIEHAMSENDDIIIFDPTQIKT